MTKKLETAIAYLQDDAFAASFQSLGQYRQAILKAIANTEEDESPATAVQPTPQSERHFAERGQALFNASEVLSNLQTHHNMWALGFRSLAGYAFENGEYDNARYWNEQAQVFDEIKVLADSVLATGIFSSDPDAVPNGSWLWGKLMDWCKAEQVAPANYNSLFAICGEAHALAAAAAGDAKPNTKQS